MWISQCCDIHSVRMKVDLSKDTVWGEEQWHSCINKLPLCLSNILQIMAHNYTHLYTSTMIILSLVSYTTTSLCNGIGFSKLEQSKLMFENRSQLLSLVTHHAAPTACYTGWTMLLLKMCGCAKHSYILCMHLVIVTHVLHLNLLSHMKPRVVLGDLAINPPEGIRIHKLHLGALLLDTFGN